MERFAKKVMKDYKAFLNIKMQIQWSIKIILKILKMAL